MDGCAQAGCKEIFLSGQFKLLPYCTSVSALGVEPRPAWAGPGGSLGPAGARPGAK